MKNRLCWIKSCTFLFLNSIYKYVNVLVCCIWHKCWNLWNDSTFRQRLLLLYDDNNDNIHRKILLYIFYYHSLYLFFHSFAKFISKHVLWCDDGCQINIYIPIRGALWCWTIHVPMSCWRNSEWGFVYILYCNRFNWESAKVINYAQSHVIVANMRIIYWSHVSYGTIIRLPSP